MTVTIHPCIVSESISQCFQDRCLLVFTGQQRLAKNVLINALRRAALTRRFDDLVPPSPHYSQNIKNEEQEDIYGVNIGDTITRLVRGAERSYTTLCHPSNTSTPDEQIDSLCDTLNTYWHLKKEMAAGTEPPHITNLLSLLKPFNTKFIMLAASL